MKRLSFAQCQIQKLYFRFHSESSANGRFSNLINHKPLISLFEYITVLNVAINGKHIIIWGKYLKVYECSSIAHRNCVRYRKDSNVSKNEKWSNLTVCVSSYTSLIIIHHRNLSLLSEAIWSSVKKKINIVYINPIHQIYI